MINKMLLKLEVFHYDMSLDLKTGCYDIILTNNASNLCTIILLLGRYCYRRLPTVIANSPEIFQQKMNY